MRLGITVRVVVAMLAVMITSAAGAQERFGGLAGVVMDSSQAPVPGATITATNKQTQATRVVVSGENGAYRIPDLEPGRYTVTVELQGFQKSQTDDVLVLLGRTASKVQAVADEIGASAMAVGCDVARPDQVKAAFAAIAERHGQIDVLINNAAIFQPSLVAEASDEHILNTINTNFTGAVLCARSAIPLLRPNGHIINVTSESVAMPFAFLTLYQAS